MVTKVCSICGVEKLVSEFYQPKSKQCKPCVRALVKDLENRPDPVLPADYKKKCRVCKQLLPSSAFHRREQSIDKLAYQCIRCGQSDHQQYDAINKNTKVNLPDNYVKKCSKCNRTLPASSFWTDMVLKDHLKSACIECETPRDKSYRKSDYGRAAIKNRITNDRKNAVSKTRARDAVSRLIKIGKLPSATSLVCIFSLTHTNVRFADHYHHWKGYSKEHRTDVKPGCRECHTILTAWESNANKAKLKALLDKHSNLVN